MKIKKIRNILFTIMLLLILSSCVDFSNEPIIPPPLPTPEPTPVPVQEIVPTAGGTLQLSMRPPQTFNPLLNEDATVARVLQLIHEPLITFDEELRPVPHLASLEFAFNGASVVVTIREDAFWSDGSPVTAADMIFSLNTLRGAPNSVVYKNNIANFAGWEAISDNAVRVTFRTINGGSAYAFNFPIIPNRATPIGSGPFMIDYYNSTEIQMALIHNPYTFRTRPYIESVQAMIIPSRETDIHAFDRGLIDIYLAEVAAWARHHSIKPVRFSQQQSMLYDFIGFNFARSIPSQPQFRQAIAHALNVESMVSDVFLTHAIAANSPIHPNSWLHEPNIPIYEYNMDTA
ncbi:MAG: ABC transporter substrate-binding protein, partial [Defluviitaleaceae bacterium]|nr:ABC transporter substrate-binding protein [Defluviitaleaceae bacterium]